MAEAAPYVAVAVALCSSSAGGWLLRRAAGALPVAVPNARALRDAPVPRAGGYAIWLGFLPPWLALVIVSGRDDVREVGVAARLSVHALAALWTAAALALSGPAASG